MPAPNSDPQQRIGELLVACQDRLLRRIRWMMGDRARLAADSDDFLGEVIARILKDAESIELRDEAHFLTFASRVARNMIVDRVRRPRVRRFESFTATLSAAKVADGHSSPSQSAARAEDIERVFDALERLGPDDQRVIELRQFAGLPFKEIGAEMGRAESAVQMLHTRAVTRLGQILRG